ncbi:hypothetical protein [Symbiopectobacterium purcellii]|uniref:hypothetical protein n=1 Tax=Symbiopectobacterium purcellii TaxID=2871826 RepID=UPI003F83E5B7
MDLANQRLETCYEPIHVDVWRTNLRLSNGAIYTKFFTDSISGIRITVEHAIAGIKRLGCMTQILRNRRPFIDDTFLLLSAGLWNFHLRTA